MASKIEFITIDNTYPVPGADNDSQGLRDNFGIIKNSLESASKEINELQENSVTKGQDNNMQDGSLSKVTLDTFTQKSLGSSGGTKLTSTAQNPIDIREGHYQYYVVGNDVSLSFTNWPAENYASIIVELTADENGPYIVTFASDNGAEIKKEPAAIWDDALLVSETFQSTSVKALIGETFVPIGPDGDPDVKRYVFKFWTYDGGGRVYAKYLGFYDITSESITGGGTIGDSTIGDSSTIGGGFDAFLDIRNETRRTYTLRLGDIGGLIRMDNALSNSVIVPTNTAVRFPTGTVVLVRKIGEGTTTIIPSSGVTVNAPRNELSISETDHGVVLVKVAANEWDMIKAFGSGSEVDLLTAQVNNISSEFDLIKPQFDNIESDFSTIKLKWDGFQTLINDTTATINSLNLQGGFENSLAANGYQKLPNGCIMQWGTTTVNAQFAKAISWPIPFPNAALSAQATIVDNSGTPPADSAGATIGSLSPTGATVGYVAPVSGITKEIYWFAIGH